MPRQDLLTVVVQKRCMASPALNASPIHRKLLCLGRLNERIHRASPPTFISTKFEANTTQVISLPPFSSPQLPKRSLGLPVSLSRLTSGWRGCSVHLLLFTILQKLRSIRCERKGKAPMDSGKWREAIQRICTQVASKAAASCGKKLLFRVVL